MSQTVYRNILIIRDLMSYRRYEKELIYKISLDLLCVTQHVASDQCRFAIPPQNNFLTRIILSRLTSQSGEEKINKKNCLDYLGLSPEYKNTNVNASAVLQNCLVRTILIFRLLCPCKIYLLNIFIYQGIRYYVLLFVLMLRS